MDKTGYASVQVTTDYDKRCGNVEKIPAVCMESATVGIDGGGCGWKSRQSEEQESARSFAILLYKLRVESRNAICTELLTLVRPVC